MPRQATTGNSSKRQRITVSAFGAPSDADIPSTQNTTPSSSAFSTRICPTTSIPSLSTLCARVFVANIGALSQDEALWDATLQSLKLLPDILIPKIFAMLRTACPTLLNHAFIVACFLRGPSITLTSALPGINKSTLSRVITIGATLHKLELDAFEKYPDTFFASLMSSCPSLRVLALRGCVKVGTRTLEAAARSCHLLRVINLNHTSTSPASLLPLLLACPQLEVLKLAGIPNWASTDATFSKFLAGLVQYEDFKLPNLRTLKLRQTSLSDTSFNSFLSLCPSLQRLDLSFTPIRRLIRLNVPLVKLSLTSTQVASADLLTIIPLLPHLKSLSLGALGGGQGSSSAIGNSTAMTMNDQTLAALTDILQTFEQLESVNMVGNTKLGSGGRGHGAIFDFIRRVGKKCKILNLAGITHLHSSDLGGLQSVDEGYSILETLVLKNTGVDDEASPWISSCPLLAILDVSGTKMTSTGLFPIIDACPKLERLDVTACRGVRVGDRRRFFEVWEAEWKHA